MYPWHPEQYWALSRYSITECAVMEIKHDEVRSEGVFFSNSFEKLKYIVSHLSERQKYFMLLGGNVDTHQCCWRGQGHTDSCALHALFKGCKFRVGTGQGERANPVGALLWRAGSVLGMTSFCNFFSSQDYDSSLLPCYGGQKCKRRWFLLNNLEIPSKTQNLQTFLI